jgi:hypothetical protein
MDQQAAPDQREEVARELAPGEAQQEGDSAAATGKTAPAAVETFEPPPGLFEFPWQEERGGLGVPTESAAAELREVFFRSLVDGRVAFVGVPGDRLMPLPSKRAMFDDLEAWLADAGDGEVDPVWRSVLEGQKPAA